MKRIGYIRTSTNKQHSARQVDELKSQCDKLYIENGVSARKKNRPIFEKAMKALGEGDELVVIAYDRAFRSVIEGLNILDGLTEKGVKIVSVTQRFDPTAPDGRLFFTIILALAEWEVGNLAKRTIHGLKAAVKRGAVLGRPRKRRNR